MQLLQMCPSELEQARQNKAILMFGVGSIEYHGSQLPLGTDFFLVDGVIQAVEKRLPDKVVAAPSLAVFSHRLCGVRTAGGNGGYRCGRLYASLCRPAGQL